ncbi:MAG: D-alanyl-D-alanine carboxypeptidase [Defluviitaleaceae bacterium]|nr:D-alanyl-D-alanine carboxypeptidase [Defluviitaleaceae bacterium]
MELRRYICAALAVVMLGTVQAWSNETPKAPSMGVNAKSAIVMEASTGKILLEQNAHEKLPPASVTKVMTMLLIYEAIGDGKINLEDMVTVSAHAAGMGGSQIFLEPMQQKSVQDLLKSVIIASANDASVALAEFIAGSEQGFVVMMNNKAKALGMNDTNFVNSSGLDVDGHVTSAYDIALMSRELINKYPEVFEYSTIWMDSIVHKTARGEEEFGLNNTNRLIRSYSGATGLKTGSTSKALYCISATATRDDMSQIAVVMGAPDPGTRFDEAKKMLDYGFANYAVSLGEPEGTVKGTIRILKGEVEEADVAIDKQISILVAKGKNRPLEHKIEMLDGLSAPAATGAKAGEIIYFQEGKEVGRSDLVITQDIAKAGLYDILGRVVRDWFSA